MPSYANVEFNIYTRPPWDPRNPKNIPIEAISWGDHTHIALTTAWALTIQKSQGLTLGRETIGIGQTERQGLTFIVISTVKSIQGLHIEPFFLFDHFCKMQK